MSEVLQLLGAIVVLGGFALSQLRVLSQQSYPYLLLNVVGSGILAVLAASEQQWGFLLLEGGWALVALWGVIARTKGQMPHRRELKEIGKKEEKRADMSFLW